MVISVRTLKERLDCKIPYCFQQSVHVAVIAHASLSAVLRLSTYVFDQFYCSTFPLLDNLTIASHDNS